MRPVEELREASRLMRERAQAATPGPWSQTIYPHGGSRIYTEQPRRLIADTYAGRANDGNSRHIAAWHPTVALAVATWLDAEADHAEGNPSDLDLPRHYPDAFAVARAYLGGTS